MDWQFDQPDRIKMTPGLREQLSQGERLNISSRNVDCPPLSEKDEEDEKDEAEVSPKIHMILHSGLKWGVRWGVSQIWPKTQF